MEAKSFKKATVPKTLLQNPSPANIQSTRLAIHVNEDNEPSCSVYIASGSRIYNLQIYLPVGASSFVVYIAMEDSSVNHGKEGLLIPELTQVTNSSVVSCCPHRSEIQRIVIAERENRNGIVLGSVDSFRHLIVSKMDANEKDADKSTYSVVPLDFGVGEGGWAGLCFDPIQWSVRPEFIATVTVNRQVFGSNTTKYTKKDVQIEAATTALYHLYRAPWTAS